MGQGLALTALERLKLATGLTGVSAGAALRSLAGVAGLAGALLVGCSGLATGAAKEHLLAAERHASLTTRELRRVWVPGVVEPLWVWQEQRRGWDGVERLATWQWSELRRGWVPVPGEPVWAGVGSRRLWVARDAAFTFEGTTT